MKIILLMRQKLIAAAVWLLIWQLAASSIGLEMLLASPLSVLRRLAVLVCTDVFWVSILFSLSRVGLGFLLAFGAGIICAVLAYRFRFVEIFLEPFMGIVKAAPVVSYIILLIIFIRLSYLSMF
ncbi:MAG: nitrate ABC transporter permease, partial [Oscillospiraceae bacterium]|nr:nitrate ABC transporter permease [Oscillospiraceae bacterium]